MKAMVLNAFMANWQTTAGHCCCKTNLSLYPVTVRSG